MDRQNNFNVQIKISFLFLGIWICLCSVSIASYTSKIDNGLDYYVSGVSSDTTPQLGGNLDTNSYNIYDTSGQLDLKDNVSISGSLSVVNNVAIDSTTFYVDAFNNRVGIGETAPDSPLEISSGGTLLHLDGTNDANLQIDKSSTNRYAALALLSGGSTLWYLGMADSDFLGDGTDFWIGTTITPKNSTTALSIDRTNNFVGIGTMQSPERLGVLGNLSVSGDLSVRNGFIINGNSKLNNAVSPSGTVYYLVIDANGNIGKSSKKYTG